MLKKIKDIMGKKDKMAPEQTEKLQDEASSVEEQEQENTGNATETLENEEFESDNIETLEALKGEITELKDKNLRLRAEFDNYKRRTMREKIEMTSTAAQDTLTALLPILDDFDRAKKNSEDESSTEQFSEGVNLVYNKLQGFMKQQGLVAMESTGGDFDPELHEAITEIPAPAEDMKGKIIDTIETGYFLKEKLIRHAKVVVGK